MMSISTRRIKNSGQGRSCQPTKKMESEEMLSHSSPSLLGNTISVRTSSLDSFTSKHNVLLPLLHSLATTARMHGKKHEIDEAWECCATMKQILQQHAESLPMKKLLAETYYRMAMIFETNEEFDEAMAHYLDSWSLFKYCKEQDALSRLAKDDMVVHSNLWMIKCLVQISDLLITIGKFDDALDVADRAVKEMVKIPQDMHRKELGEMKDKVLSNFNTILNNGDSDN